MALKAAAASVGSLGFASDTSKDAAIAIESPPGIHTATVSGKNSTTCVCLVKVYELPQLPDVTTASWSRRKKASA